MPPHDDAAVGAARAKVRRGFEDKGGSWTGQDCFSFLGLVPGTTGTVAVQRRFRLLSLAIHPDKVALLPAPVPAECAEKMQQLVAYRDAALRSPLLGRAAAAAPAPADVRQKCADCKELGEANWMGGGLWLCPSCWRVRKAEITKTAKASREAIKKRKAEVRRLAAERRRGRRACEAAAAAASEQKRACQAAAAAERKRARREEADRGAGAAAAAEGPGWERRESRSHPGIFYIWHAATSRSVLAADPRAAWLAGGAAALRVAGWQRLESRSSRGVYYFFEAATGRTVAEVEEGEEDQEEEEEEEAEEAEGAEAGGEGLPEGWEVRESRSSPGTFYYYSWKTGESRMERPAS